MSFYCLQRAVAVVWRGRYAAWTQTTWSWQVSLARRGKGERGGRQRKLTWSKSSRHAWALPLLHKSWAAHPGEIITIVIIILPILRPSHTCCRATSSQNIETAYSVLFKSETVPVCTLLPGFCRWSYSPEPLKRTFITALCFKMQLSACWRRTWALQYPRRPGEKGRESLDRRANDLAVCCRWIIHRRASGAAGRLRHFLGRWLAVLLAE